MTDKSRFNKLTQGELQALGSHVADHLANYQGRIQTTLAASKLLIATIRQLEADESLTVYARHDAVRKAYIAFLDLVDAMLSDYGLKL